MEQLKKIKSQRNLILMGLPGILLMLLFSYVPMIWIATAFQDYQPTKGLLHSSFIGVANFRNFLSTDIMYLILRNTLGISVLKLLIGFPVSLVFALLLNEVRHMLFKRVLQTVAYLPHFLSWVVVIGIWGKILATDDGLVNQVLEYYHIQSIPFMSTSWFMWPFAVFSEIWKETGWNAIIFLAALAGINPQLYEAAKVDGAGRWKQLLHVTLPGIKSTIMVLLVISIPGVVNANTDQMWVIGTLPVRDVTEVIDTYVLRTGLGSNQYSLAAAGGLFKSIVSITLLILADRLSKRATGDSIL